MRIIADVRPFALGLQRNKWIGLAPRQTGIEQTLHRGYRFVELERCPPNKMPGDCSPGILFG